MKKKNLDKNWKFRCVNNDEWYNENVPCSVLTTYLKEKIIENPFYSTNEYKAKEFFYNDFEYVCKFDVSDNDLQCNQVNLVFQGIDTIANIYLNNELLKSVNDMHRTYRLEVKNILKPTNILKIHIKSPLKYIEEIHKNSDITYAAGGCTHGNGALRKAHYMFGWDWGPVLPDAGISRPVYLEFVNTAKIDDLVVYQNHMNNEVTLNVNAKLENFSDDNLRAKLIITDTNLNAITKECNIINNSITDEIKIENPVLWWPNGYGSQDLYQVELQLFIKEELIDRQQLKIGLREIILCTEKDEWGNEFAFSINGIKIFAMGANYVPQDSLIPRVNKDNTEILIRDCALANYNFIRVWGGGYYPENYFYELCDKYGIIVWQDLMFACNVYNLNDEFEENIINETKDIVKRIRHHACLGLWCGNNEMEWGINDWSKLKNIRPKYKADYIKVFEMILPRVVQELDKQTSYWLSSPSSGGSYDNPNDFNRGDNHYWDVWHCNEPFTNYKKFHFRFCSEYGFQSFPNIKTINTYCPKDEQNIFSEIMESHQKNGTANQKIFSYISEYFKYPKDMTSIAYISQILQLKAIQYGVEHWRRNSPRCMGSLYWQLNDCWPVASWSSIDYYGRWKALHYGAKRFYNLVLLSACEQDECSPIIEYYVNNDTLEEKTFTFEVSVCDFNLNKLHTYENSLTSKSFSVNKCFDADFSSIVLDREKNTFASIALYENGIEIQSACNLFAKPKHINFPKPKIVFNVMEDENKYTISLSSDVFAYYVELSLLHDDCIFSDNYFHITDKNIKKIYIYKEYISNEKLTIEDIRSTLVISTVSDSY